MGKMIVVCILMAHLTAFAQSTKLKYTISGRYGSYNAPAKVYLEYTLHHKETIDSTTLKNGVFKFTGRATVAPVSANLIFDTRGVGRTKSYERRALYLEHGNIKVESMEGNTAKMKVTGTPYNNDHNDLDSLISVEISKMSLDDRNFAEGKMNPNDADFAAKAEGFRKRYSIAMTNAYTKFVKSHLNSSLSLTLMSKIAYEQDYNVVKPLFDGLTSKIKNSSKGKEIAKSLEQMKATANGQFAPDFEMSDTAGNLIKLSSFRGKYVLLDFWASWCGPCRAENPNLINTYNRFKNQNFTVVGISLDKPNSRALWLGAIKKDGLPWVQLSDLKFWDSEAAKLYGVRAIPQNFLIDPHGKIIGKTLLGNQLNSKLTEIFPSTVENN